MVVLGAGAGAEALIVRLRRHPQMGLRPVACLDNHENTQGECAGVPIAGPLSMAHSLARALRVHHALVAMPEVAREDLLWMLDDWSAAFRHVILIPDLFGIASLWVSARDWVAFSGSSCARICWFGGIAGPNALSISPAPLWLEPLPCR